MQDEDQKQAETGWVFKPGNEGNMSNAIVENNATSKSQSKPSPGVSWSASEYIANPKNTSWYALLAACSVVLAVIVYFITSDILSTVAIVILGIIVGVFAARQPLVLDYQLDTKGLHLGQKFFPYETFKTFSVVNEGAFSHISLLPLKRFMPPLAIHYSPDDEEKIINTLADYLPYEEHKGDIVESFSRRVRF